MIEKRKFRRHAFNTDGSILVRGKKGQHEKVLIRLKDLSRSGVKFTTQKRPHLETDERIIISLNFNDNQHTAFVKEAAVKSIDDNYIRAEFYSLCGDVAALKQQKP